MSAGEHVVLLSDGVIGLRRPEAIDEPFYYAMRNDLDAVTSVMGYRRGVSKAKITGWIAAQGSPEEIVYTAVDLERESRPVGYVKAFRFDHESRTAWVGLALFGKGDRRKGYGKRMFKLLLDYLRDEMGVRKVSLEVLARNAAALGLYKKLGFTEEGHMHEQYFTGGKFEDTFILSLQLSR